MGGVALGLGIAWWMNPRVDAAPGERQTTRSLPQAGSSGRGSLPNDAVLGSMLSNLDAPSPTRRSDAVAGQFLMVA